MNFREHKKWYFLLILFLATLFVWFLLFQEKRESLSVSFLDVGQGDAVFIETPHGNQILIDGGPPNKKVLRELGKKMPFYDRHIDVVIGTHPDADHIGGFIDVLKRFNTGIFIDPGVSSDTPIFQEVENIILEKKIKNIIAKRGMKLLIDDGAYIDILFPDRDVSRLDTNDASIVARLLYGDHEFLLTGDSPQKIEKYLSYLDGKNLESDVLKVGHHGSKTSTSGEFLSAVKPKYAVISSGKDNSYRHPHKEILDRLGDFGVQVLRTDTLGTITFKTDGKIMTIK
jgi:competence protein ComEC